MSGTFAAYTLSILTCIPGQKPNKSSNWDCTCFKISFSWDYKSLIVNHPWSHCACNTGVYRGQGHAAETAHQHAWFQGLSSSVPGAWKWWGPYHIHQPSACDQHCQKLQGSANFQIHPNHIYQILMCTCLSRWYKLEIIFITIIHFHNCKVSHLRQQSHCKLIRLKLLNTDLKLIPKATTPGCANYLGLKVYSWAFLSFQRMSSVRLVKDLLSKTLVCSMSEFWTV